MLFPTVVLSLLFAMLYMAYYNQEGIKMYGIIGSKQYKYQDFVSVRPYKEGINLFRVTFTDGASYIIGSRGKYLLTQESSQTAVKMEAEMRNFFERNNEKNIIKST